MATTSPVDDRQRSMAARVQETLDKSKNCAQTSFSVLQEEFGFEGHHILRALTPFPGIALRGETCGAVTGCLMALGVVYGRDDLGDWKGYLSSLPPCRRFCRRFQQEHGSTACADLLETKMGHRYDLADRVDALKYTMAGGKKVCGDIITSAVHLTSGLISARP